MKTLQEIRKANRLAVAKYRQTQKGKAANRKYAQRRWARIKAVAALTSTNQEK